jgi:hypothetical protein
MAARGVSTRGVADSTLGVEATAMVVVASTQGAADTAIIGASMLHEAVIITVVCVAAMASVQAGVSKVTLAVMDFEGVEITFMASLVARRAWVLVTMMRIGEVQMQIFREV